MRFYAQLSHVVYALIEDDMPHKLFLSGGGHGMNIWVTFDAPKRVDVMKQLADFILKKAGLKRKAGGEFADAFVKNYDPGTRDDWAATGLCLQAAFGKENEWDRLSSASQYRPLPFCRFAEAKGYSGKIPFTATEKRKLPTKRATECELNHW